MPESVSAMPGDVVAPASAPAAPAPVAKQVEKSSVAPVLPKRQPKPAPPGKDAVIVQVAAFSTAERAKSAAAKLGGQVTQAGRFWRLHLGPYADRGTAAAALGKAKAAGYSDARIPRVD
jgi:rare lipoprotein A